MSMNNPEASPSSPRSPDGQSAAPPVDPSAVVQPSPEDQLFADDLVRELRSRGHSDERVLDYVQRPANSFSHQKIDAVRRILCGQSQPEPGDTTDQDAADAASDQHLAPALVSQTTESDIGEYVEFEILPKPTQPPTDVTTENAQPTGRTRRKRAANGEAARRPDAELEAAHDFAGHIDHQQAKTVEHVPVDDLQVPCWQSTPITDEELDALVQDVARDGVVMPLLVWAHDNVNDVICGTSRLAAAKRNNLKLVPVIFAHFPGEPEARIRAILDNVCRRHRSTAWKAEMALTVADLMQEALHVRPGPKTSSNLAKIDVRAEAAKRVGVSAGSISAMKVVLDHGDEKLLNAVRTEKVSLAAAALLVKGKKQLKRNGTPDDADTKRVLKLSYTYRRACSSLDAAEKELLGLLDSPSCHGLDPERLRTALTEVAGNPRTSDELRQRIGNLLDRPGAHNDVA